VTAGTTDGGRDWPSWDVPVELLVVLGPDTGVPAGPPASAGPAPGTGAPGSAAPGSTAPPPNRPLTALEALRRLAPVTLDCPPRLALVRLPPERAGEVTGQPYVVGVYAAAPPPAVTAALRPAERLFVDAWLLRVEDRDYRKRRRPGDRLPWDTPGYEPPDPPGSAIPA